MIDSLEVIAHRGDPINATENSLEAIRYAIDHGSRIIEIDIRLSSDGEVVLVHDETTERIHGEPRPVADQTLAELRTLRAADGSGISTLAEALEVVAGRGVLLVDMTSAEFAAPAVAIVHAAGERGTAWCGDHEALKVVRRLLPEAEIYLSMDEEPDLPPAELVEELAPAWINPSHQAITAEYAAEVSERGIGLSAWTVDNETEAARLVQLGAGRIISNRPSEIRTFLKGC